jgi:hypothetical protein
MTGQPRGGDELVIETTRKDLTELGVSGLMGPVVLYEE